MSYASTVLADGAVGYYRMDDTTNAGACVDASLNQDGAYGAQAGVAVGQAGIPATSGNTAVKFTAASFGTVTIADKAAQHVGDIFTMEAWVKRASNGADHTIFCGSSSAPMIRISAADRLELVKAQVSVLVASTTTITDTSYHHVVATKTGATVKLYIDGVDVTGVVTNATMSNAAGYNLAREKTSINAWFNGTLDEVALYPTALSAATVLTHYQMNAAAMALLGSPPFLLLFSH